MPAGTKPAAKLLDDIACHILQELQEDARISFAELGRRVGLSTPAVMERVRRLEEADVIRGYRAEINPALIGAPITAFIRVAVTGELLARFITVTKKLPEVLECHRVTGSESFIIKVAVASIEHMEATIDKLTPYVATTTSIVLSSPVPWRAFQPIRDDRKRSRLGRNSSQSGR